MFIICRQHPKDINKQTNRRAVKDPYEQMNRKAYNGEMCNTLGKRAIEHKDEITVSRNHVQLLQYRFSKIRIYDRVLVAVAADDDIERHIVAVGWRRHDVRSVDGEPPLGRDECECIPRISRWPLELVVGLANEHLVAGNH